MGRAKLTVGILLASTLLAAGVILFANQPDEVERLMRSSGPVETEDSWPRRSDPNVRESLTLPGQGIASNSLFLELKSRGWRTTIFESFDGGQAWARLKPPEVGSSRSIGFVLDNKELMMIYHRPPTQAERTVHTLKSFLRIAD